ncbi:MAG: carboxynorspermidine decarboxylase [Akkermansia sp.]|nr:carboxynorspermidine decarboxylase [Akkermansia sp.]
MARFILSLAALERNARVLREVAQRSGAHMLLALKAFSTTSCFSALKEAAAGCCASGLYEARLGHRYLGGHVAVFSPAYRPRELAELLCFAHHIDFNSLPQWMRFREQCLAHPRAREGRVRFGLRLNPCYSTGHTPMYDPCVPGSRLGIPPEQLQGADLRGISGLHIHTLCEQGAQDLIDTFRAFEQHFGSLAASPAITYLNLGGGHWITKPDYDREALIALLREIRQRYGTELFLEPGEAWAIHTGVLRVKVLDVFESLGYHHAILDASASAHMPDVLEMPYRPDVFLPTPYGSDTPALSLPGEHYTRAGEPGVLPYTYRLGGPTCLAGDVIGDYSFPCMLRPGDELVLDDMAHYTIVKTSHFNGVPHPAISVLHPDGREETVCQLHYEDFLRRLG